MSKRYNNILKIGKAIIVQRLKKIGNLSKPLFIEAPKLFFFQISQYDKGAYATPMMYHNWKYLENWQS